MQLESVTRRGVLGAIGGAALRGKTRQPNLLFVVADTWRGQALPSAGDSNVSTPNLERLAREGVFCSRAYTSYPVCCPSRAAMLTGRYPHAAGVRQNHTLLPLNQRTMSQAFKTAGYRTGYIGKWHLDGRENPGFVPPERRRGFDYWAAYNVAHQHYDSVYFRDDPAPVKTTGFEPEVLTNLAVDFVRQRSERPFYLYLSLVAPHAPFTPPERSAVRDTERLRLRPNVPASAAERARKDLAGYYGLCAAVDANVGRLVKELARTGGEEDTIVLFTSDHGNTLWSHGSEEIDRPFEECCRIPLIVRYPARIKPGSRTSALISNVDYAPTLLSLCNVPPPGEMQGANAAGLLTGGGGGSRDSIFAEGAIGQSDEWRMMVRGRHKLVTDGSLRPTGFFDLDNDPYEQENLAANPRARGMVESMQARMRAWALRTGDRTG